MSITKKTFLCWLLRYSFTLILTYVGIQPTSYANPIFSKGITNTYSIVTKNAFVNRATVVLFGQIVWDRKSDHFILIDKTGAVYLAPTREKDLQELSRLKSQVKVIGLINKKINAITIEILDLQQVEVNT
ncbi:hypothetical protein [Vibrio cholerae]|uniref:hypothetical protein n=1 Tax=Vibrio cholerae TaxID=666 RepID=UPI0022F2E82F|nr:hypothetical protein [Vibrio cholerae]MDA5313186.1 hypothetical protein [Vibrio cholerae]